MKLWNIIQNKKPAIEYGKVKTALDFVGLQINKTWRVDSSVSI